MNNDTIGEDSPALEAPPALDDIKTFILAQAKALEAFARLTTNTADDSVVAVLTMIVNTPSWLDFAAGFISRWLGGESSVMAVESLPAEVQADAQAFSFDPTKIFEGIALIQQLITFIRSFWGK